MKVIPTGMSWDAILMQTMNKNNYSDRSNQVSWLQNNSAE